MKKIAIYGGGEIGKPTTTSNLSAALAARGLRVMQIGCDSKADSTKNLMTGKRIPTVFDQICQKEEVVSLEDIVFRGYGSIVYVELGGSTLGIGCAGRGTITIFEKPEELEAYGVLQSDVAFYDVLGGMVCGGFTTLMRGGHVDHVMIVTSGGMIALFTTDNIVHVIRSFGERGYAKLADFIQSSRNVEGEDKRVHLAAEENGTEILHIVPRDRPVQLAENQGMTVIEAYPDSPMAACYQALADKVLGVTEI